MFQQFRNSHPVIQFLMAIFIAGFVFFTFLLISFGVGYLIYGQKALNLLALEDFSDPSVLPIMQFYQIVQSTALFVIPPFVIAWLFSSSITEYLCINKRFSIQQVFLVIVIIFSVLPLINYIVEINSKISFPESWGTVEQYLKNKEELATKQTEAFLNVRSYSGLALNIFMVGILAALGEELMFRGVIQRIFTNMTNNPHIGILISAFIFSAVHMQFYGFFPRMLLGIILGYLLFWSGSIWLPIIAHFINNTMAVIGYFMVNTGKLSKETLEVGSSNDLLPFTFLSTAVFIYACYVFYRKSEARVVINKELKS